MNTATRTLARTFTLLALAFGLGMFAGCDKQQTKSPDGADESDKSDEDSKNLCKAYATCDECIAGQQTKGADKGTAETECGAAVLGCWTTWEKPITCSGKEMSNDEG